MFSVAARTLSAKGLTFFGPRFCKAGSEVLDPEKDNKVKVCLCRFCGISEVGAGTRLGSGIKR